MELRLLDIIGLLTSFIALIFVFFLLTFRSDRKLGHYLLAAYFSIYIVDSLAGIIDHHLAPVMPGATMFLKTLIFLEPPLLYLFIRASVYRDYILSGRTGLHALPYVLINLLFIPGYYSHVAEKGFSEKEIEAFYDSPFFSLTYVVIHIQLLVYFILIFLLLRKYRQQLIENFSNADMENYQWLFKFILIIFTFSTFALVKNVLRFFMPGKPFDYSLIFVSLCVLWFFIWLLLKAMKNPALFIGIPAATPTVSELMPLADPAPSHASSPAISEADQTRITQLKEFMDNHQPFLDPSLNLYQLAEKTKLPEKELSLLINHRMGQHFFDFINDFRIRKAESILKDPLQKNLTILEILYSVGFNSKSSFNTAFKRRTGLTPTEYRKKHSNSAS